MMETGQGEWCSMACATEPRRMPRIPPRPREPTTTIWAAAAAASSSPVGDPFATCRKTVTS